MALMKCADCQHDVSDRALTCPHCGRPVERPEETLLVAQPALWNSAAFMGGALLALVFALVVLILLVMGRGLVAAGFGVGLLLSLLYTGRAWLRLRSVRLTITTHRCLLARGILTTTTNELRHVVIQDVLVTQSLSDKLFGVGTITISTAAEADGDLTIAGLADPKGVADLINQQRR